MNEFVLSVTPICRSEGVETRDFLIKRTGMRIALLLLVARGVSACIGTNSSSSNAPAPSASSAAAVAAAQFASGQKGVKIITSTNALSVPAGSFAVPASTPTAMVIPSGYPGYDGTNAYLPGVVPSTYYDLSGITATKPSWLIDFQLGITSKTASSACATFGGSGTLDAQSFYRVSESNCLGKTGAGGPVDPVFMRIILDRSTTQIGSAENLLIQIEYQASGIHYNSDGTNADPEKNLDQLWKVFWDSTLGSGFSPKPFAVFVPPNFSACVETGTGDAAAAVAAGMANLCDTTAHPSYRGSPTKTRQLIIPLSAYPTLSVIQISRVHGRVDTGTNYISPAGTNPFCTTDDPLCAGVVIHSVTLMRM